MKKEAGITLVSLVVTIIILIILAGISINRLVGDNGIITKAQQAKENILLAQEEEAKQLNQLYNQLDSMGSTVDNTDNQIIEKLKNFKKVIATAITNEGVETLETDSEEVMSENIGKIVQEKTKNATATTEDIVKGKTAWVNGNLITGTLLNGGKLTISGDKRTIPEGVKKAYILAVHSTGHNYNQTYVSGSIIQSKRQVDMISITKSDVFSAGAELIELDLSGASGTISVSFSGGSEGISGSLMDMYTLVYAKQ